MAEVENAEWMIAKKNYPLSHRVKIVRLGGDAMEGKTGHILGKSFENVHDHYIVMLDEPTETHLAVVITEHCLISA